MKEAMATVKKINWLKGGKAEVIFSGKVPSKIVDKKRAKELAVGGKLPIKNGKVII